jgi:hypothetical protein
MKSTIRALIATFCSSVSLIAAPDMVGEWTTAYGRYSDTITYKADGSYVSVTEIVKGAEDGQETIAKATGTWKMNGDELIHVGEGGSLKMKIRFVSQSSFENLLASDGEGRIYEKSEATPNTKVVKQQAAGQEKVTEPKIGSPERKAIMDAMRGPVSKRAGTEVIFTGSVALYKDWVKLSGHVSPKNGKPFPEEVADEMEMDFLAILRKVNGKWQTLYYGWSGDVGALMEARLRIPEIPEILIPKF